MKVALLGDVHANLPALEAVLADARRRGAEAVWDVGDSVGYGAFPAALMPHLWKIKQPYNVSVAASAAAITALQDRDYLEQQLVRIIAQRERLVQSLGDIPYLRPYPSRANFVLCRVVGRDARQLKLTLEGEGVLIRHFNKPGLRDHVRISVGRADQTDALVAALRRL